MFYMDCFIDLIIFFNWGVKVDEHGLFEYCFVNVDEHCLFECCCTLKAEHGLFECCCCTLN